MIRVEKMFIPLSEGERQAFIHQTSGCHIPGYTGHCPTLKFRFGKRYGANTKEIIQELGSKAPPKRHEPYRPHDTRAALTPIIRTQGQTRDYSQDVKHKSRRYILGYTGYMPGMNFRYGSSFKRSADESDLQFRTRLAGEEQRRTREHAQYMSTRPHKMTTLRSKDEVAKAIAQYNDRYKHHAYNDNHISAEFPPIAGYTGHIPRLQGTMSQSFNTAAKHGLTALRREREQRCETPGAYDAVLEAIDSARMRYTTPAV